MGFARDLLGIWIGAAKTNQISIISIISIKFGHTFPDDILYQRQYDEFSEWQQAALTTAWSYINFPRIPANFS